MSRGHARMRSQTTRRILERCQNSGNIEDAIIIDDDTENADAVLIDNPNTCHQGSKNSNRTRSNCSPRGVIYIDDEEEDPINSSSDSASNQFTKRSSSMSLPEDSDSSDESLMFVGNVRGSYDHTGSSSSRNRFGLDLDSESSMDESTSVISEVDEYDEFVGSSSDCEIMEDPSGIIREQWEKAASRKKEGCQFASSDQATACGSTVYPEDTFHASIFHNADVLYSFEKMRFSHYLDELLSQLALRRSKNAEKNSPANIFSTNENNDFCFKTSVDISTTKTCPNNHIPYKETGKWRKDDESSSEECPQTARSKADDPNFLNKDAQEPVKASFFTYESQAKAYSDKEEPSSRTSRDFPKQVSKDDVICPDGVKEKTEVSYNAQSKHEIAAEREDADLFGGVSSNVKSKLEMTAECEAADFKDNKKGDSEESSHFCSRQHVEPLTNIQSSTVCGNMDVKRKSKVDAVLESSDVGPTSLKLDDWPHGYGSLIGERERHKETDEYRRVTEEEWASRQLQLQIQAEEAQRMRKRRKAENIRLLDMEKRQKHRLEEIRNMQKKDEETTKLKEQIRVDVRKDLERVEMKCRGMASVLRALGIHVKGGSIPLVHEINAAYKQALLRFHPDRASRTDIRQQVEAEEKFKLISRLKEKLLP